LTERNSPRRNGWHLEGNRMTKLTTSTHTAPMGLALAAFIVLGSFAGRARADLFVGVVNGSGGAPLADAHITVNGSGRGLSAADGSFSVEAARSPLGDIVVVAWPGYVTGRERVASTAPTTGLVFALAALPVDDATFTPETPGRCAECHAPYSSGWSGAGGYDGSGHSTSATNAAVLDIFRGTASGRTDAASCALVGGSFEEVSDASGARVMRCYVGVGLLPDENAACGHAGQPRCDDTSAPASARPTQLSDCAGCHTPGAAMRLPALTDLGDAEIAPEESSVTCAACHRIRDVLDPNAAGVLVGATLVRAEDPTALPLALGPLDDAAALQMRTSWSPLHATSRMCAPCHQDTYSAPGIVARFPDGVPSEQTYAEWLESPYASGAREATCQSCHMPTLAELGVAPSFAGIGTGGPTRTPAEMHAHDFKPLTEPAELAAALEVAVDARQEGSALVVSTSVTNEGVGHGFPSGVTSRNALLVVSAHDATGRLREIGGEVLPLYAGSFASGQIVSSTGSTVTLDRDVSTDSVGRELRVWVETDAFREHQSFGVLRPLTTSEKGWRASASLGRFRIAAVRGSEVDIEGDLPASAAGARFAVGDERRLAGTSGVGFAKVNVAADGAPNVPFWRAVDLISDYRLASDETRTSEHRFALRPGAGDITVTARLVYRKTFVDLADERGWTLTDILAGEAEDVVAVDVPVDGGVPDTSIDGSMDASIAPTPAKDGCNCSAVGAVRDSGAVPGGGALALLCLGGALAALRFGARWRRHARGVA